MADLSNFTSSGTTYDFSKGPKGIYYAQGDEDLFGLILNVPQTDDDDEWGGTERIALERITDKIGELEAYVEDPYGSGTDGLLNRVTALENVVDTSTPKITLGNVEINGSTDQITIGSSMTLTSSGLTLGDFSLSLSNPLAYLIDFKDVSLYMTDTGATKQFQIKVGSTSYLFTQTELILSQLNLSGDLTVTGDVTGTNVTATGVVHGATVCGDDISTFNHLKVQGDIQGHLVPWTSGAYNIGNPTSRWLGLAATTVDISGTITSGGSITSGGNLAATDVNVNDVNCHDILGNALVMASATICGQLKARNTIPETPSSYTLGLNANRWSHIYGDVVTVTSTITAGGNVTITGGDIVTDQKVQAADMRVTTYVRFDDTSSPFAIASAIPMWYDSGSGTRTHLFIKEPGGTIREIEYV